MISISEYNEIFIAAGADWKVHVYLNKGDNFVNDDSLMDSSSDVVTADITGDGKWIMSVGKHGAVYIYKFSFKTHKFEQYQQIVSSSRIFGGDMTDDHLWMAFGENDGIVSVYTFDGSSFILDQTIDQLPSVRSLALTNDHEMLAVATVYDVYIYQHNGTKFNLIQTLSPGSSYTKVSWTDDHQYLTFGEYYPYFAFVYNNTGGSYTMIENNGEFSKKHESSLRDISFSSSKKLLAVSSESGLDLYANFEAGYATLEQTIEQSVKTHQISKDEAYLILGSDTLEVYMNDEYPNCNIYHCTKCLNSTYCEHCNELLDYFLDEVGTCQLCNITGCIECEDVTTCNTCDD